MKKLLSNLNHWKTAQRAIPLVLFLLLSSSFMTAQTKVQGSVKDDTGMPIPGVNVTVSGTKQAVSTDFEGSYSVQVAENAVLSFSSIGFTTQKITVNGQSKINVVLKSISEGLKEVVVIGYGTQKKSNLTSAISSLKAKDIADTPQIGMDQLLQGKLAGVTVTNNSGAPGSSVSVKIRGASSLTGSNEPLYIIDGVPISGNAADRNSGGALVSGYVGGNSGAVATSPLSLINPNDIESIDVLKDASATAIYGSRASNGVILVTTKTGKKGSGKLTYDSFISVQEVSRLLDTANLREYAQSQNALAPYQLRDEFAVPSVLGEGTNWQKEIFRSALLNSHQLSFSGAKEGTSYYLSGGFVDQQGIVIGSAYKRYNFRTNIDSKVKDWLKVGANISSGISSEDISLQGYSEGIISQTILTTPDVAVRDNNGNYAGPPKNGSQGSWINPVAAALMDTKKLNKKSFSANIYSELNLLKGLVYRFELGGYSEFGNFEGFNPTYTWGIAERKVNELTTRSNTFYSVNVKNLLTYTKSINSNNIVVLLGQEAYDAHWSGNSQYVSGLSSNDVQSLNLGNPKSLTADAYKGSSGLSSYFTRLSYDYNDRYFLSGTYRADGSSNIAEKWDYFPSVSGAWKLSNESFMSNTKRYIDNIKFRLGYGETGNQNTTGSYQARISTLKSDFGGVFYPVANIANPGLKWERQKQTNAGLDFSLFNSKLNASVDVYRKTSEGFLVDLPLPKYLTGTEVYQGGLGAPQVNLGTMLNEGFDLSLSYSTKIGENFSWNSGANLSKYRNELLSLQDNFDLIAEVQVNGYTTKTVSKSMVGRSIGEYWGYETVGIIRTNEQLSNAPIPFTGNKAVPSSLGDIEYVDQNKDGLIDEKDLTHIGNPHPKFTYGFNNKFGYKNFELIANIQGSYGNKVMNLTRRAATLNQYMYQNQLAEALDFWTPTNVDAKNPRPVNSEGHPNIAISDRYVEDGSYLRLQNITFAYSLPTDVISKVKLTKLRFYGGIQNLYTFTNYTGYDPEIGSYNQNVLLSGIDSGRYPTPRTFTFGLNVEF